VGNKFTGAQRTGTKRFKAPTEQQRRLAEGVIKFGNTFKQAAIAAGYSPKVAKLGPAYMRRHSVGVNVAFIEAAKQLTWKPAELKAMAISRLVSDISNGKSSGVSREIETLGKIKEHDWFVRTGDVQVGIFAGLDSKELDEITIEPEPTDK
jgi:hypothetical protein